MQKNNSKKIIEAIEILTALGLPKAQRNERSAICLLALLNVTPDKSWSQAEAPLLGIRAMLDFAREQYEKPYAENTRESLRRQTMHQFVQGQIALYNPDNPARSVNSPNAVYQIAPKVLTLLKGFQTPRWESELHEFMSDFIPLLEKFGMAREMVKIPVEVRPGKIVRLSPGAHSELIKVIIEEFAPRYAPGGMLVYAGDTGEKWGYFDEALLDKLGVSVDAHGKMPDVVIYLPSKGWLLLIESVTSHGPVDSKRHHELKELFKECSAGLVYVTAFPDRATMKRYLGDIAWETEVWVADAPSHLIHFNGDRFLGPHISGASE
jgi:hypothetical protein